ncbi:adenylate cyclase type 10 isoform X2 [Lissotriton helveticus]
MANKKGYGADQLTKTLNNYIGEIVDRVLTAGGDILNFAGDALLALWKVERVQLSDVITLAAKCSLDIQKDCGVRNTEVGVELRVKIGISAGRISKVVVGNQQQEFFVVIGRAVDEVRLAEGLAEASTIILSPNAWELCDRTTIVSEKIVNERAVKLRRILKNPSFDLERYLLKYGSHLQHEASARDSCRRVSQLKPNAVLEKTLRKYVMSTVLQKIDDYQPLEFLSEMRPVTIMFLNLQFKESAKIEHQCQAMQDTSNVIIKLIRRYNGRINKVFMFDKGCTFLCIFGLPGDKLEDECTHALRSAFKIHVFCNEQLEKIRVASIGVTNGPVFCGVVGHALRHEYTVIGRKVNLAARMMMHYPGFVCCDEETQFDSKLPPYFFYELPKKAMKGVKNPGIIYQYLGDKENTVIGKSRLVMERDTRYPLLGREQEMSWYSTTKNNWFLQFKDNWQNAKRAVIFEGAPGYGKSRIMAEINFLAQREGHRVVAMELAKLNIRQPFYTIQTLIAMYLRIDVCKTYMEREKIIESKMADPENEWKLCLLNTLFFVKFPISEKVSLMDQETKEKEMAKFLMDIVKKDALRNEPLMLIIDQAHYIDTFSWQFLAKLFVTEPFFFIMALCPYRHERPPPEAALTLIKSVKTVYIYLRPLKPSVISELACQTLGVTSIPTEVEMLLVERSYGIPYYCEELLRSMYINKIIIMEPMEEEDEDDEGILVSKRMSISANQAWKKRSDRRGSSIKWQLMNPRRVMSLAGDRTEEDTVFICTLSEAVKLQNMPLPFTLKGIALAQLDHMSTSEQMAVKCASVIGQTFLFKLLHHILPERSQKKVVQTLMSLVKSRIFECASPRPENRNERGKMGFCFCPKETTESESRMYLPELKGWPCKTMRFCTPLLQETAYELWLREQVTELHLKCANFLEKGAHKCESCGGGEFIFEHRLATETISSQYDLGGAPEQAHGIVENKSSLSQEALDVFQESPKGSSPFQRIPLTAKRSGSSYRRIMEAQLKIADYLKQQSPVEPCPEGQERVFPKLRSLTESASTRRQPPQRRPIVPAVGSQVPPREEKERSASSDEKVPEDEGTAAGTSSEDPKEDEPSHESSTHSLKGQSPGSIDPIVPTVPAPSRPGMVRVTSGHPEAASSISSRRIPQENNLILQSILSIVQNGSLAQDTAVFQEKETASKSSRKLKRSSSLDISSSAGHEYTEVKKESRTHSLGKQGGGITDQDLVVGTAPATPLPVDPSEPSSSGPEAATSSRTIQHEKPLILKSILKTSRDSSKKDNMFDLEEVDRKALPASPDGATRKEFTGLQTLDEIPWEQDLLPSQGAASILAIEKNNNDHPPEVLSSDTVDHALLSELPPLPPGGSTESHSSRSPSVTSSRRQSLQENPIILQSLLNVLRATSEMEESAILQEQEGMVDAPTNAVLHDPEIAIWNRYTSLQFEGATDQLHSSARLALNTVDNVLSSIHVPSPAAGLVGSPSSILGNIPNLCEVQNSYVGPLIPQSILSVILDDIEQDFIEMLEAHAAASTDSRVQSGVDTIIWDHSSPPNDDLHVENESIAPTTGGYSRDTAGNLMATALSSSSTAPITGSPSSVHEAATNRGEVLPKKSFILPSRLKELKDKEEKEETVVQESQEIKGLSMSSVIEINLDKTLLKGVEATISGHASLELHEEDHLQINSVSRANSLGKYQHEAVEPSVSSASASPSTAPITGSPSSEHAAATKRGEVQDKKSFILPSRLNVLKDKEENEETVVQESQEIKGLSMSSVIEINLDKTLLKGVEATISGHASLELHEEDHLQINSVSRANSLGKYQHEAVEPSVSSASASPSTAPITGSPSSEHAAATKRGEVQDKKSFILPSRLNVLKDKEEKEETVVQESQEIKGLSMSYVIEANLDKTLLKGVEATISGHASLELHEEDHLQINSVSSANSPAQYQHKTVDPGVSSVSSRPYTAPITGSPRSEHEAATKRSEVLPKKSFILPSRLNVLKDMEEKKETVVQEVKVIKALSISSVIEDNLDHTVMKVVEATISEHASLELQEEDKLQINIVSSAKSLDMDEHETVDPSVLSASARPSTDTFQLANSAPEAVTRSSGSRTLQGRSHIKQSILSLTHRISPSKKYKSKSRHWKGKIPRSSSRMKAATDNSEIQDEDATAEDGDVPQVFESRTILAPIDPSETDSSVTASQGVCVNIQPTSSPIWQHSKHSRTRNIVEPLTTALLDNRSEFNFLEQMDMMLQHQRAKNQEEPKTCTCLHVQDSVVSALARHWLGVGDVPKTVYYLLETAAAALHLSNNYKALSFLNEASYIIDLVTNKKKKAELLEITKTKVELPDFEIACLNRLKGEVLFNMGNITEAKELLKKALQLLNRSYPVNPVSVLFKVAIERAMMPVYQRRRLRAQHEDLFDDAKIPYLYEQIHCLSLMWKIECVSSRLDGKMRAFLAVLMQVNSAEQTGIESQIILAYMDCFQCCQILGFRERCQRYELMAMDRSRYLPMTNDGLLVMAKLAKAMANTKLCFGNLSQAVEFGYRSHKLAGLLNSPALEIAVLPIMFQALFLEQRYEECIEVVSFLEQVITKNSTIIAQAWFNIVCLEILLQGGFAYKPFDDCLDFVDKNHTHSVLVADNRLMLSLIASLALWFARLEEWDNFKPAYKKAKKLVQHTNASYFAIFGYSKFLECQILVLRKVLIDKVEELEDVKETTIAHLDTFMSLCVTTPLFFDRALHLKAFIFMLTGRELAAAQLVQKALESCRKHENKQEETWLKLNNELWFETEGVVADAWLSATGDMPDWEEAQQMDKETLYQTKFLLRPALRPGDVMEGDSTASLDYLFQGRMK